AARKVQEDAAFSAVSGRRHTPAHTVDSVGFNEVTAVAAAGITPGAAERKVGTGTAFAVIDTITKVGGAIDAAARDALAGSEIHSIPIRAGHLDIAGADVIRVLGVDHSGRAAAADRYAVTIDLDVAEGPDSPVCGAGI